MFKEYVGNTALTSEVANDYFGNILYAGSPSVPRWADTSMLATARALIAPRMGDDGRLCIRMMESGDADRVKNRIDLGYSGERIVASLTNGVDPDVGDSLHLCNVTGGGDSLAAVMKLAEDNFEKTFEGYHRLPKITDFYIKSFKVLCYINPEIKSTILILENMNLRRFHYLQCSILAMMPWYYDQTVGVNEDELGLINALREKSPDNYLRLINKIASRYDFESARIRKLLAGFETRADREALNTVKNSIEHLDERLDELRTSFTTYMEKRNEECIKLLGIEAKIRNSEGKDSEIMNYFMCNKSLFLCGTDSKSVTFIARGYLTYYDEDAAKRYIDNQDSYVYNYCSPRWITPDQMKELMTAIFIDEELNLQVCAAYTIYMNGGVRGITGYDYTAKSGAFEEYMPNPHIDRYRCLGNHETQINMLLKERNYIGAIEQCVASAKSVNFHDSIVMEKFCSGLCDSSVMRCIELPDGSVVTPMDAVKWLESRKNNAETTEEGA